MDRDVNAAANILLVGTCRFRPTAMSRTHGAVASLNVSSAASLVGEESESEEKGEEEEGEESMRGINLPVNAGRSSSNPSLDVQF